METESNPTTAHPDVSSLLSTPSELDKWVSHLEGLALERWLADVRTALETGSSEDWELAGPAVVVEHPYIELTEAKLRHLTHDSGIRLARIPNGGFNPLKPDLRGRFEALAPVIVLLSSDDLSASFIADSETSLLAFARTNLGRFNPTKPVLLVLAVDSLLATSEALLGIEWFNRQLRLNPPDTEVLGPLFLDLLGAAIVSDDLTRQIRKVGLLIRDSYPDLEKIRLFALQMKRFARTENRALTFSDLVHLTLRGAIEHQDQPHQRSTEAYRRKVARHEAGHVCISVIESMGDSIPEYASITPSREFEGVVVDSIYHRERKEELTFAHLQWKIRVWLAGRAAEELFYGSPNVSNGPDSDLACATALCRQLFSQSGFHPSMTTNGVSGMNLAVLPERAMDPLQNDRITGEVRAFLAEQYAHVIRVLQENRAFVDAVVERLMWDPVVDQAEIAEIAKQHDVTIAPAELA